MSINCKWVSKDDDRDITSATIVDVRLPIVELAIVAYIGALYYWYTTTSVVVDDDEEEEEEEYEPPPLYEFVNRVTDSR